jgi:hypothetical protein
MTRFLPAQIFSVSVLAYGCRAVCLGLRASPFGVQIDVPGVGEDRTGCEKVARGSKWQLGAKVETRAASWRAARDVPARGPTLKRAARPFFFIFGFFSPFSPSGPHFTPISSFAHILLSRTSIDDPSSPTRSTSKHLLIPTLLSSFEQLECATLVILLFMSFCFFLVIQDSDRRSVFAYASYR